VGIRAALLGVFLFVAALAPVLVLSRPDPPGPVTAAPTTTSLAPSPSQSPSPSWSPSVSPTSAPRTTPPPRGRPSPTFTRVRPLPASDPLPPWTPNQEFVSICGVAGHDGGFVVLGGSACLNPADGSLYRVPALLSGGRPLDPDRGEMFYKSGVRDYPTIRPFPIGLRLLTPDLAAVRAAGANASWDCGGRTTELPASCPPGNNLILRLEAPSCWDGQRLDSPDHAAHMTWPLLDRCPAGYPVAVPKLEVNVIYKLPPSPLSLRLTTGAGSTARVDYTARWQPAAQATLIANCLHRGRRCDETGTDPGNP
jgi:hypothetical protein